MTMKENPNSPFAAALEPSTAEEEHTAGKSGSDGGQSKVAKPGFKSTSEIPVPDKLIDQVIGQERGSEIIKKAAAQRRNVLLMGEPGTGKSMLAQAMAELMPQQDLEDIIMYPNDLDENMPKVRLLKTYPGKDQVESDQELKEIYKDSKLIDAQRKTMIDEQRKKGFYIDESRLKGGVGCGRLLVEYHKRSRNRMFNPENQKSFKISPMFIVMGLLLFAVIGYFLLKDLDPIQRIFIVVMVMFGMIIVGLFYMLYSFISGFARRPMMMPMENNTPKMIVDNTGRVSAPFIDATGSKSGALLGDVKHDPLQTGGLGTPAHLRVEAGAVHRAHMGVLFIDEISSLKMSSQQEILTAMQEKRYSITGQSELSSGALVKTEPVPCDFVLVAAGNMMDISNMHPALRSRIRGAGYEVFVNDTMEDNEENVNRIFQFIAQEVRKDGKIPHFSWESALFIVDEARKLASRKGKLTLKLRELGGLIRASGDVANSEKAELVLPEHIKKAKIVAVTFEGQLARKYTEYKKDYSVFLNKGVAIGKVNGLAVIGNSSSGIIQPIVAEVTPASSRDEGKVIATGKLGEIAKEAVQNISALIKKHLGKNTADYDIHIQYLQSYDGIEGDSASISTAVAVISALEGLPVSQEFAMTGSLSVRGEILPVGGVTPKIEAAFEAGIRSVIIPESNAKDLFLSEEAKKKVQLHTAKSIVDVLELVLKDGAKKKELIRKISKEMD